MGESKGTDNGYTKLHELCAKSTNRGISVVKAQIDTLLQEDKNSLEEVTYDGKTVLLLALETESKRNQQAKIVQQAQTNWFAKTTPFRPASIVEYLISKGADTAGIHDYCRTIASASNEKTFHIEVAWSNYYERNKAFAHKLWAEQMLEMFNNQSLQDKPIKGTLVRFVFKNHAMLGSVRSYSDYFMNRNKDSSYTGGDLQGADLDPDVARVYELLRNGKLLENDGTVHEVTLYKNKLSRNFFPKFNVLVEQLETISGGTVKGIKWKLRSGSTVEAKGLEPLISEIGRNYEAIEYINIEIHGKRDKGGTLNSNPYGLKDLKF